MYKMFKKIAGTGIVTTDYPRKREEAPERFRGRPRAGAKCEGCRSCIPVCPTGAIVPKGKGIDIDLGRCIFCGRCEEVCGKDVVTITREYELAYLGDRLQDKVQEVLGRSLHIREVDAGSCNGCEVEVTALSNPVHDVERFGVHFVASPRHADMLLVTGPVARNMEMALRKTYEAAADPRLVAACGTCACGGGVYRDSYATVGCLERVLPVDVYIPGCPPRPQALIHGILLALGRLERER